MLLQLLSTHPEAIVPVLRQTPLWVWGTLAALLTLGISQLRDRTASLARVSLMPLAMAVVVWLGAAILVSALFTRGRANAEYDAALRQYRLPGSTVPLLLIVGIFLVKYVVGVDLVMAPQLVQDATYVLGVAALYGAFTGSFIGRTSRLWRLSMRPALA